MRFLDGIPATRKEELLKQLKAVWQTTLDLVAEARQGPLLVRR